MVPMYTAFYASEWLQEAPEVSPRQEAWSLEEKSRILQSMIQYHRRIAYYLTSCQQVDFTMRTQYGRRPPAVFNCERCERVRCPHRRLRIGGRLPLLRWTWGSNSEYIVECIRVWAPFSKPYHTIPYMCPVPALNPKPAICQCKCSATVLCTGV